MATLDQRLFTVRGVGEAIKLARDLLLAGEYTEGVGEILARRISAHSVDQYRKEFTKVYEKLVEAGEIESHEF
jgi:hypothetical protein